MGIIARLTAAPAPKKTPPVRRGFAGAAISRLTYSLTQSSQSVNADLDNALVILRARSRSLCTNNEYGKRFLSLVKTNVVGPKGPTLQVRRFDRNGRLDKQMNDAVETHWARWARRCDVTGRLSLPMLLRIAVAAAARDGESLILPVRSREYRYGFALQILEADRLDESLNRVEPNGNVIRQGVELDSRSRPVAYWLWESHPGENFNYRGARRHIRVPAEDVLHVFLPERAEQVRGYPWLHAVLMRASMLAGYEEAALVAARVGASKMGAFVRKTEESAGSPLEMVADGRGRDGSLQMTAEPGEFMDLTDLPGVSLETWDPQYPHENYESFVKQCLRALAAGLDVATHNLSGDITEVNYSSARVGELAERDIWVALQDWLIDSCLFPIYAEWLSVGLLREEITFFNRTPIPERFYQDILDNSRFQGRRWAWVDPQKEAAAARELINARLVSRTEIAASQGREWEDVADELAMEERILKEQGLSGAPSSAPARPQPQPNEGEGNNGE